MSSNVYELYVPDHPSGTRYFEVFQAACFFDAIVLMWPATYTRYQFLPQDVRNSKFKKIYRHGSLPTVAVELIEEKSIESFIGI